MRAPATLIAAALAFALAATAQNRRIDVATPTPILVVGTENRLSAMLRDPNDVPVPGAAFTFTSNQPAIISVDREGVIRALRPGQATIAISAVGGGASVASVEIIAVPGRIQVDPPQRTLLVGERLQFTATAFDINNQPIPNVPFTWQATGANGGPINAASISAQGVLTALGISRVTVRALINYAARADRFPPQFLATTTVDIQHRAQYTVTRLASTEEVRGPFAMRRLLSSIAGNDRGQFAFRASLDGLASCVMLFDAGRFDCVSSAGEPRPLGSAFITPFGQPAINNRGQVLFGVSGIGLALYSREGTTYPIQEGAFFGDYVMLGGFSVSRGSLNEGGDIAWLFSFRRTANNVALRGLARLVQGEPEFVWSSDQQLEGLAGTPAIEDWGIDGSGTVFFQAAGNPGRGLFRAERFSKPQRLIGIGDANEGSTITNIGNLQVAEDGTIAFWISRQNGTQSIARWKAGKLETIRVTGSPISALAIHQTGGIAFRGDTGQGYGLYRWRGNNTDLVWIRTKNAPGNEAISAFNAGYITADGSIFAQVGTAQREFGVFNASGGDSPPMLVQTGAGLDVTARLHLVNGLSLMAGERGDSPLRLRLGDVRSIYEFSSGKLAPRLLDLDMLPDNSRFFAFTDNIESPAGDLYIPANGSIYRINGANGQADVFLRNQATTEDGARLNFNGGVRPGMNSSGAMALVAVTQTGERRLYLARDSRLELMGTIGRTNVQGGEVITAVRTLAVDNAGRVMAFFDVRDTQPGLYLYEGSTWRPVAVPGVNEVGGLPVRDVVRGPIAAGNSFVALITRSSGAQVLQTLCEYKGGNWSVVLAPNDPLPQGNLVSTFGVFDINDRGEMAFWVNGQTGGASGLMFRTADGNLRLVHQLVQPVIGDEYILNVSEIDLRNDGRIYWGSVTFRDAYTLYMAQPAR